MADNPYRYYVVIDPRGGRSMKFNFAWRTGIYNYGVTIYSTRFDPALVNAKTILTHLISVESPAFRRGEVVIVDPATGKEACGRLREPSHWDCAFEVYERLEDAVARSRQIREYNDERADRGIPPAAVKPIEVFERDWYTGKKETEK